MNIILQEYKNENKNNVYKALEEGMYDAKIIDVRLQRSKTNKQMLCVTFELQGEKMLNGAHLGGRIERYYIVLEDKYAGSKLHTLLQSVGVDVKPGDEINVQQLVTSNVLINKELQVKLKKTNYINANGETKECNAVSYTKAKVKHNFINTTTVVENVIDDEDIPF